MIKWIRFILVITMPLIVYGIFLNKSIEMERADTEYCYAVVFGYGDQSNPDYDGCFKRLRDKSTNRY